MHAGAGGVGLPADSDRKENWSEVIATVGTAEKGELARAAGAHEIIIYSQRDFEAEVKKMTNAAGVVKWLRRGRRRDMGKSLNCLKPRGYLVLWKCQRTGSSIRSSWYS